MARMHPLTKYAIGIATIAAVSGAVGFAQTMLPNTHGTPTPVVQVQPTPNVSQAADIQATVSGPIEPASDVVDAVDTLATPSANLKVMNPDASTTTDVISPDEIATDVTYTEPVELEDEYVWVEDDHEHEHEHEDWDEGGGYDE